ncbi:MAG TPA: penicillin acylase family protein [Streptosporangiaceae bacterium]|nr:penicillin acylase family protein [Streptosporangiaceae bacterium]
MGGSRSQAKIRSRGPKGSRGRLTVIAAGAALTAMAMLPGAAPAAARAAGGPGRLGATGSRAPAGAVTVGHGTFQARIARDSFGVPTITARSTAGMWFGAGWAQAQDRMIQLELTRRAVEGTLSEIFGPSELSQDETVRTIFYTPAEVQAQYASLSPPMRQALAAFSSGINAYEATAYASPASEQGKVPYEFFVLGQVLGLNGPYRPAPWQPADSVAIGNFLARQFGGGGGSELTNLQYLNYLFAELIAKGDRQPATHAGQIFNDARWFNDPTAPTTVPGASAAPPTRATAGAAIRAVRHALGYLSGISRRDLAGAAAALNTDRNNILRTGISLRVLAHGGSNAIAIAPRRSADHHALLWGAPQEGFGTPSIDGEEYLHAPGYDAGGMDITGEPFILIGRNSHIAWTTTSEELVDQRIYVENVNFQASPPTYQFDGKQVPMTVINERIPVAGQSPVSFPVLRTIDGPVIFAEPSSGLAFSLRFASWMRETGTLTGFAQLGGDQDLSQFRRSMSLITTLHNFLYADRLGNIAYFGDGLVPIEPSFTTVDPRLPALGNGTQQWKGFVPFSQMPHSINPAQGYLDNWNTKPSQQLYYQQNGGDEYWGTIFRSSLIAVLAASSTRISVKYLEGIEHAIGTIDNNDNTRPAAPYFIPFLVHAYDRLVAAHDPLTDPATHPDLARAVAVLAHWNDVTTLGSPAMSIFMNFLEALERNVFEGGTLPGEQYTGKVNFSDASLQLGLYGGLGNMATYNLLYHILAGTNGIQPCSTLCYTGGYFAGHRDQILVESLNDAIAILSGTGTQLGQNVPGFGTLDIADWGYQPYIDQNWDNLDPLAAGVTTHCGASATQNRSTFMMAVDVGRTTVTGQDVLPPGQSGFLSAAGLPSPHFCDQVGLFDAFRYKRMPPA